MSKKPMVIALSIASAVLLSAYNLADWQQALVQNEGFMEIHNPKDGSAFILEEGMIDISPEMVPLTSAPAMFNMPMPAAPGSSVKKNEKAVIDYSNSKDGYVMIRYLKKVSKPLKVLIKGPSGVQYTYSLRSDGEYEVYPLSDGSGSYQIGVYENVDGSKYATSNTATISVKLKDEFAPFLRPNQYVNYTKKSKTVVKAAELIKDAKDLTGKIAAVYNYVVDNLTYDTKLAETVKSGYLPDIDAVLEKGKGICFDYAAVMTAMLRSQNIPCKLVIGFAGEAYHAWINAYSEEEGWIDSVIYFDGKTWKLMDPTYASTGAKSAEVMKYIGDGKNYTTKYLY